MIIPSYFGDLASSQNLQLIIDQSQDVLGQQSIWRNYLTLGLPQMSLDFTDVIGRDRISAAASIVDSDAPAPLRSRNKVERYSGKIPAMKEKFRMNQDDMRALEVLRALPLNGSEAALQNFLIKDVQEASVAGDKRVDIMMLQGMSTLAVDTTATLNPDGAVFGTIDLLPAYGTAVQQQGVPIVWSSVTTSTPIDDIDNFITINRNVRGRTFGAIYMSAALWVNFKKSTQVKNYLAGFYNTGRANNATSFAVTQDNVNEYMSANNWPPIVVVNYTAMIEVDGIPTYIQPFNANNVVFAPAGKLGVLANAVPMERLHQVTGKEYANYGATLVGKWRENDPLVEFTGMEMNAFPVLNVDGIFILNTNTVLATFI
jgi:hypothetical protein